MSALRHRLAFLEQDLALAKAQQALGITKEDEIKWLEAKISETAERWAAEELEAWACDERVMASFAPKVTVTVVNPDEPKRCRNCGKLLNQHEFGICWGCDQ